jgi:hypothetical protein
VANRLIHGIKTVWLWRMLRIDAYCSSFMIGDLPTQNTEDAECFESSQDDNKSGT